MRITVHHLLVVHSDTGLVVGHSLFITLALTEQLTVNGSLGLGTVHGPLLPSVESVLLTNLGDDGLVVLTGLLSFSQGCQLR